MAEALLVAAQPGAWGTVRVFDLVPHLAERRRHRGRIVFDGPSEALRDEAVLRGHMGLAGDGRAAEPPSRGCGPALSGR